MREVCMLSAKAGRNTPCWWDCGTYCRRRIVGIKKGLGGFKPTDIANLAAWFQNNKGITSSLGAVSQWDDQSGNGRHLKQATGTNQPALQADGSILFDGVDNYLKCDAFTLSQPITYYLLANQITWTDNDVLVDGNTNDVGLLHQSGSTPALRIYAGAGVALAASPSIGAYHVLYAVFNGASSVVGADNGATSTGNAGASNMGGLTLGAHADGASNWSNIQAKEFIVYAAAHDAATRNVVINYLMNLGGL